MSKKYYRRRALRTAQKWKQVKLAGDGAYSSQPTRKLEEALAIVNRGAMK